MSKECNTHSKKDVNFKIIKTLKTVKDYGLFFKQKGIKHKAECINCGQKLEVVTDYEDYNDVIYCWVK